MICSKNQLNCFYKWEILVVNWLKYFSRASKYMFEVIYNSTRLISWMLHWICSKLTMFLCNGLNWQQAILTSLDEWPVNLNREHILKLGKNMLALPKSQKVYENPNFTEILLLSSTLSPPPPRATPKLDSVFTHVALQVMGHCQFVRWSICWRNSKYYDEKAKGAI